MLVSPREADTPDSIYAPTKPATGLMSWSRGHFGMPRWRLPRKLVTRRRQRHNLDPSPYVSYSITLESRNTSEDSSRGGAKGSSEESGRCSTRYHPPSTVNHVLGPIDLSHRILVSGTIETPRGHILAK